MPCMSGIKYLDTSPSIPGRHREEDPPKPSAYFQM